ncbi:hypothetical protein GCM10027190_26140 [Spirosoma areae]
MSLSVEPLPDGISLKWTPRFYFEEGMFGEDKSVIPAQYEIYISENSEKELRKVAVLDGNIQEYALHNQPEGKTIYAWVKAVHPKLTTSTSNIATTNTGRLGTSDMLFPDNTLYATYGAWGGLSLVYSGLEGIAIVQPDGRVHKLNGKGGWPVLSADGQTVAFPATINTNTSYSTQLFVETVATGTLRLLDTQQAIYSVEWSNDGQFLAYIAYAQGQNKSVWTRSITENKRVRLYTPAIGPNQLTDGQIDWSPDGTFIVAAQERGYIPEHGAVSNLMKIPVIGGEPQPMLLSDWRDEQPAFSPDGQRLAFISNRSGYQAIWVMNIKTGKLQQITGSQEQLAYTNRLDWMNNTQLTYTARLPPPPDLALKKVTLP